MEDIISDPIEMLEAQYCYLGEVLGELGFAESWEDRAAWLLDFTLETHLAARMEQQLHLAIVAADTRFFIQGAAAERAVMAQVLLHLEREGNPQGDGFGSLLVTLQALLRSHIARQRSELYGLVRERLSGAARQLCAERLSVERLRAARTGQESGRRPDAAAAPVRPVCS
jgi:hypothetical protein